MSLWHSSYISTAFVIFVSIFFLFPTHLYATETSDQKLFDMSLEELLNTKVSVVSKNQTTIRETPGIITKITHDEIVAMGARDLVDILRAVPGFSFGSDVQNSLGLGIRGLWGSEGKILVMIDGLTMNEDLYSTIQFGNHFLMENVEYIEVIRGPGSAIYGGYSELAVINIVTRSAESVNGVTVGTSIGRMESGMLRHNIHLAVGQVYQDLSVAFQLASGKGNRSDRDYTDFYGSTFKVKNNARLDPTFAHLDLKYRQIQLQWLLDYYHTTNQDGFDAIFDHPAKTDFNTNIVNLSYEWKTTDKLSITPKLNYKNSQPWLCTDKAITDVAYADFTLQRITGEVQANYLASEKFSILGGVEYFDDGGKLNSTSPDTLTLANGRRQVNYQNTAAYTQLSLQSRYGNYSAGARYNHHSASGTSFVPRFAMTKIFNKLHLKLLYSKAFRAPAIRHLELNQNLKPEETSVYECETGYLLTSNMFITANAFYNMIDKPIVYYVDTVSEGYANFNKMATQGIEFEYKWKPKWGMMAVNYSYYQVSQNRVVNYEVPDHPEQLLAMPSHKINLIATYRVSNRIGIHPSLTYTSKVYGYIPVDTTGTGELSSLSPCTLVNLNVTMDDCFIKGLKIGLGCYNLGNTKIDYVQGYNSGHAPLPGASREVILRLDYNTGF